MILSIDCDEGILKIGSPPEILPGIVDSIKINNSLLIEDTEAQGRSGKVKIVQGWDDIDVQISLLLIDDPGAAKTRWDYLKQITGVFKKIASNGKPEIYTLSHPMIKAWGTKQLLFTSLETSESRTKRTITASLAFMEYESFSGVIQDRKKNDDSAKPKQEDISAARERMMVSEGQRRGLGSMEARYGK